MFPHISTSTLRKMTRPVFGEYSERIRGLGRVSLLLGLMAWVALTSGVGRTQQSVESSEQLTQDDRDSFRFSESYLLASFDRDENSELSAEEARRVRSELGVSDFPLLPDTPYRYSDIELPTYLESLGIQGSDNELESNRLSDEGATLGRVLFYDRQLSKNDTIACASCHFQENGFSDPRRVSHGFEGGVTERNAMSLLNLRYSNIRGRSSGFFWDERAETLEAQALMPIQDEIEMGMSLDELEAKLQEIPYYPFLFEQAFGSPEVRRDRVADALAQFMRSMTSFDSRFDQAAEAMGGSDLSRDFESFSAAENLGKSLFIIGKGGDGEIGCAHCHVPPTFNMPTAFNNGLDLVYLDQGLGRRNVPVRDPFAESNDGLFKSSSLRNIELTAPYMHDGRFDTLEEVIDHYSEGVFPHPNLGLAVAFDESSETSGFEFTEEEKQGLLAFLRTLTDQSFVNDHRFGDPFVRIE